MDPYQCAVKSHGLRELEMQLDYPLPRHRPGRVTYDLKLWLFSPAPLQVNADHFTAADFFQNLNSYTRYRTPGLSLASLVDPSCELSPLVRLRAELAKRERGEELDEERFRYELKTLVVVARVQVKLGRRNLRRKIAERAPTEELRTGIDRLLTESDQLLQAFHELAQQVELPGVPEELQTEYRFADEALSLAVERAALVLGRELAAAALLPDLARRCRRTGADQSNRRERRGYPSVVRPNDAEANERFVFREHTLKKWAEAAMYMSTPESRTVRGLTQVLFGGAAAVAMGFALVMSLVAKDWFQAGGLYGALVIVIAYIFKDRIKEALRSLTLRLVPRWIADRIHRIVDPKGGRRCGRSKERAGYTTLEELPAAIRRLRLLHKEARRPRVQRESVLAYHKEITLDSRPLLAAHERLTAISEILRLNLAPWLARMDDPDETLLCYDAEADAVREVRADRVYHLALILRLDTSGRDSGEPQLYRYRVVLKRSGILRVEEVSALAS
jgi:hypothetical protein